MVVVELVTLVVVTDGVAGFSTVVVAGVVVDSDDAIEDVREVELVEKSPEVDAEDVVINIDDVDDVAVLVESVMTAEVDVTLVDTTSAGVMDVELVDVRESSEVLDKEVTSDV
jgi:hemolysin activation/secretion protein